MNKTSYTPEQKKQILTGLGIMLIGIIGFFVTMASLGLFGHAIDYSTIGLLKQAVPLAFLIFSMYGIGYLIGKNTIGLAWARYGVIIFTAAILLGYLGGKYTPTIQPYFPAVILLIVYFCFGYLPNHDWKKGLKNVVIIFLAIVVVGLLKILFKQ